MSGEVERAQFSQLKTVYAKAQKLVTYYTILGMFVLIWMNFYANSKYSKYGNENLI